MNRSFTGGRPARRLLAVVAAVALTTQALPAGSAVAAPAPAGAGISVGTWNTMLQPWLPYENQVIDTIRATDLDVLALQEVWTPEAKDRIVDDPQIRAKYPYHHYTSAYQEPGYCTAVPRFFQEDYINALVAEGIDTRTLEQPAVRVSDETTLLALFLALSSLPCFAAIVNTLQSLDPSIPPLSVVEVAEEGGDADSYAHGGRPGLLVLSSTPLTDVVEVPFDSYLVKRAAVFATISGTRFGFSQLPSDLLADYDATLGGLQPGSLQADIARYLIGQDPDVLVGDFNSGPDYQPEGHNLLVANGYAPLFDQPTYCPPATHAAFAPCVTPTTVFGPATTPRSIDNIYVRRGAALCPGRRSFATVPASDHIGLAVTCEFPLTPVLDDFNRPDGRVGGNWDGLTDTAFYRLAAGRLDVQAGGPLVWKPAAFGATQEAFVRLHTVDPKGPAQGLLLKVQPGKAPDAGALSVTYDARARVVRVSALRVGARTWTFYPTVAAAFAGGDALGARTLPDGTVTVFRNGRPVGGVALTGADRTFFAPRGGRIGIWTLGSPGSVLDDFGGGSTPGR